MRAALVLAVMLLLAGCTLPRGTMPGGDDGSAVDDDAPQFVAVRVVEGGWEPRMATGPDGMQWVSTQEPGGVGGQESVYFSATGLNWTRVSIVPSSQPNADNEIIVLPSGRILSAVINATGISLDIHWSDDNGTTWTPSTGQALQDQDREWLAYGPQNADGTYDVYMVWHNLGSGAAQHNMWVTTSHDSGATFGAPVPVTLPGSQAYLDLQCADSGGPSAIRVDQETGMVMAFWGTRTSPAGGCGASITGPFEINVVAATRLWVATSTDEGQTWEDSIVFDASEEGNILGMQGFETALDNENNVYVAFPMSPQPYPNFAGAAITYVWAPPGLAQWSDPITVVTGGDGSKPGEGHILANVVAGDPGMLAFFYMTGDGNDTGALWYPTVAETWDQGAHVTEQRVSDIPAWNGTASALMGVCERVPPLLGPLGGPVNSAVAGFTCPRTSDMYGQTLTADCRPAFVYYGDEVLEDTHGTYVVEQTAGRSLCSAPSKA